MGSEEPSLPDTSRTNTGGTTSNRPGYDGGYDRLGLRPGHVELVFVEVTGFHLKLCS